MGVCFYKVFSPRAPYIIMRNIKPHNKERYGNGETMKKFTFLSLVLIMSILTLNAQQKVKEVVSTEYNRPSVSYVFVDRTQSHAADVQRFYNTLEVGEKFDKNIIPTTLINVKHNNGVPAANTDVTNAVNQYGLGKEVISYLFNRKSNGTFDDSIIQQRGLYNAKDQDILNMSAAKVKELTLEWGEPLVNTSYVVVVDIYETSVSKDNSGKSSYSVKSMAHAYKLNGDREVLDNFYMNAWADDSYTQEEKEKANAAYNNMQFDLTHITSVSATSSSGESIYSACNAVYEDIVYKLEKEIAGWKSNSGIISVKPIAAKIGKKEGVKNGSRFQTYSFKMGRDGNMKSVKHGMIRATVVANNVGVATGDTKPSYFYQISGFSNVKEGYTLQQKNDLKLGVALTGGINAIGLRAGADLDYIAHIGKRGCITYAMVNIGFNTPISDSDDLEDALSMSLLDAQIGAGYGIPITRFVEVTPFVTGGCLVNLEDADESSLSGEDSSKIAGYVAEPGIRLAATFQPFSIFVSGGYQACFGVAEAIEDGLAGGIFIKAGLKWTF